MSKELEERLGRLEEAVAELARVQQLHERRIKAMDTWNNVLERRMERLTDLLTEVRVAVLAKDGQP